MGRLIAEMTYPECRDLIDERAIVVLPIGGGSKEHGAHLPMGTDYFVTDYLAKRITERCDVFTLPTLPYAYFPAFVDWKGSVNIEADHLIAYVQDILLSFVRYGVKKFLILDGGVSTHIPLRLVALNMNDKYNVKVAVSNCLGLGHEAEAECCKQEKGGHGDEAETSDMLVIRPDLVRMDQTTEEYSGALPGCFRNGVMRVYLPHKMATVSGTNGNSTLATREKGEAMLAAKVNDLAAFLDSFAKWDMRPIP